MLLSIYKLFLAGWILLVMTGCQSMNPSNFGLCGDARQNSGVTAVDKKLNYGVLTYEEGKYQASTVAFQGVLEAPLSGKPEKVMAYKYLAFIQCVSGHEVMCRDYFKKALEFDPNFNLDTAEAGHPIWGPVFRSVKNKSVK